jgi:hypothetical protein
VIKPSQKALYDVHRRGSPSVKAATIWSQDMHTGVIVDGNLTIKNPFVP